MSDEFWTAIGTLVLSPFMLVIFALIIGAIAVVACVDRDSRKK